MDTNNTVVALVFTCLGLTLFVYRVLYMMCQGLPWNNQPYVFSWGLTLIIYGFTLFLTIAFAPPCPNQACERLNEYPFYLSIASASVSTVLALYLLTTSWIDFVNDYQAKKKAQSPSPYSYLHDDDDDGIAECIAYAYSAHNRRSFDAMRDQGNNGDRRPWLSGVDLIFMGIGLAVLLGNYSLGKCPSHC